MMRKRSKVRGQHGDPQRTVSREFARRLLAWYDAQARALPWRQNKDPYRIWLSEIMLQQTRVAAVLEHYRLFLKKFATVRKLAAARESSVLAAWSGLGYYRRARMLHAAARVVMREHGGKFPASRDGLLALPGIGRYTAAAIASIAFNEPVAVVDGNVERVTGRVVGKPLTCEATWQTAESWLDHARPGDFNQALMELGATICLPRQPRCLLCPVAEFCATRGELPSASPTNRQKKRTIHVALAQRNGSVFLVRRKRDESLMPGMWELPSCEPNGHSKTLLSVRHSITVTDYTVRVLEIDKPEEAMGRWVSRSQLAALPITGLTRKILRRTQVS